MPTVVLRAYGCTVSISGPGIALDAARQLLPDTYREVIADPERRWQIRRHGSGWEWRAGGERRGASDDVLTCAGALLSDLELWVAEKARRRVFVHAGCVTFDGRALILPGRSMSGKSSLTAALLRAGATYYSDEYAVLDSVGMVRPYPRRLSIRPYDGSPSVQTSVEDLGCRTGRGPAVPGLIALLRYDPALGWSTEALSRGQAILRVLEQTVAARSRPNAILTALERLTAVAPTVVGTRGDADETAGLLLKLLKS